MQEKSRIKKNILQYLDYKGVSKYRFYQDTGITRGILDQNNGISEDNIARFIAHYMEVSPEWLLTGRGAMLRHSYKVVGEEGEKNATMEPAATPQNDVETECLKEEIRELRKKEMLLAESNKMLAESNKNLAETLSAMQHGR